MFGHWIFYPLHLSADEDDTLIQGINSYRASLNLRALSNNDNAECLVDEIADKFKNQPCTNTTGSNTVAGTEPWFSDHLNLLAKCHLNVTNTQYGAIMPACVPSLEPSLVLSNFTKSQYSGTLNNTKYTGTGIGSKTNWLSLFWPQTHPLEALFLLLKLSVWFPRLILSTPCFFWWVIFRYCE